jgi:DNA polymerase zeta
LYFGLQHRKSTDLHVFQAVKIIDSTEKWGAKVVYGDTDSLFIYLRGKTKDQAFRIGHDIADSITALNPAPIKLKFEKVI